MTDYNTDAPATPIVEVLQALDGGKILAFFAEEFRRAQIAVAETGQPGAVSLTVKMSPYKDGVEGQLVYIPTVAAKVPAFKPKRLIAFLDVNGNLSRTDPAQMQIQFDREPAQ